MALVATTSLLGLVTGPQLATYGARDTRRTSSVALSFVSEALRRAEPSLAIVLSSADAKAVKGGDVVHGGAVCVRVGEETVLLTSLAAVRECSARQRLMVALATDGYEQLLPAIQVGEAPEVGLALLQLEGDAALPAAIVMAASDDLAVGDFVLCATNPRAASGGKPVLGILRGSASLPSLAPPSTEDRPTRGTPAGTAEAALEEAEAAAEIDAEARGESPFLVSESAVAADGLLRGGPLLSADGELLGVTVLVLPDDGGTSRWFSVSACRTQRAVQAMIERRALGEPVRTARVVLWNDSINKRERVAAVLAAAGLSEQAAGLAMSA